MTTTFGFFSALFATTGTSARRVTLKHLLSLAKQRKDLANLDENALRDIGVSPKDAAQEAARPVWDAPDHWLR